MNEIRRSEIEITAETFHACILKANAKIEASLKVIGVKGEALNNVTDDSEFGDSKFLDNQICFSRERPCEAQRPKKMTI